MAQKDRVKPTDAYPQSVKKRRLVVLAQVESTVSPVAVLENDLVVGWCYGGDCVSVKHGTGGLTIYRLDVRPYSIPQNPLQTVVVLHYRYGVIFYFNGYPATVDKSFQRVALVG